MRRTFVEHNVRKVTNLDGVWKLTPHNGCEKTYPAMVPGVWEMIPELATFRGISDYERSVTITEAGSYLLRIGAVSHTGIVYWDEKPVRRHYNAFTGFDILLENVEAGTHTLRINVDNRFTEQSTLHIPNDYFTYGGINRSVEIQKVAPVFVSRTAFHSKKNDGCYTAYVSVFVKAITDTAAEVSISLAGKEATAVVKAVKGLETEVKFTLDCGSVTEWDVLKPCLYNLTASVCIDGKTVDDLTDRIGFRTVELKGEDILLNGKKLLIRGFNRHEDHGLFGCAMPMQAMMQDLQMVLDTGANSIRTCHYPNDPMFLDLCDELGILVWEEHHARALPIEILRTPLFDEQEAACNREMIEQHVNHPCIYIWGVLNECESETEEGRAIYAKQLAHLRQLDPTRPVSFASCRFFADICMDLVDVVSWNIYPRWYVDESVESYLGRLIAWLEEHGAKNKPMLITEIGAGGIAGYHDPFELSMWSEERQKQILTEQISTCMNHPRLSGVYVWQFADTRVSEKDWAQKRPQTRNNKGIVDLYRRPKMSYFAIKELYSGEKR